MKLAIMQPYLFPYIGYWQLINAVDTFIIYDDVAYIQRGWINRNNFLINGEKKLFTMTVKNASQNSLINQLEIHDDFSKFQKMLRFNYAKAPHFDEVMDLLSEIITFDRKNLAKFLENSIALVSSYLKITTTMTLSSSINKDNSLKGQDKILEICKLMHASDYYNAIGGTDLYSRNDFIDNGISLRFIKSNLSQYKQFKNDFISGLSIIDVMMFISVDIINEMLNDYVLI